MPDLWLILGLIGGAVLGLVTWGRAQRAKGRDDAAREAVQEDLETIRRVQDATSYPDDVDAALGRLRDRQDKR